MLYMALFRNQLLIGLSNIILCQVEGIRSIIVSDLISESVSDVNNNKFENHENSTFKYFLPLGVWTVMHMISDFCIILIHLKVLSEISNYPLKIVCMKATTNIYKQLCNLTLYTSQTYSDK